MGLPTVAEELERARRELLEPKAGHKARIEDGPLSGFMVDVRRTASGRVWFETMTGIKGSADAKSMVRVDD